MNVSVIIPCFNAEPYLAQAIGSALDQSHRPHEVIVVDDGSTDGSLAIADRFADHEEHRVRVLSERSGQAARTRNIGAALATGEALLFLDADDVLGPTALEALVGALERQPGGLAICPWYRLELHEGGHWVQRPPSCAPRRREDSALSAWLTGWYHPPCSLLWSAEAFERAGRWDERWNPNDDGDLVMRALALGLPLTEAHTGAGYYRRLPEGATTLSGGRLTREGVAARIRTVQKIAYLLEEQGRLRAHREPIAAAFQSIAASARHHPDLSAHAEACARPYAPFPPTRALTRAARQVQAQGQRLHRGIRRRLGGGETERAQTTAERAPAISWGLARAEQVLVAEARPPAGRRPPYAPPAVSVIVPTYNRARLLSRALASVLAQTFGDFELLVVDDGSTDETSAVVASCGDPRVRYLRQPENRGVSAARNRGLREARGAFVAFLDSDDEWLPDKLARQVALLRRLPDEVGLVYTGVESVYADGTCRIDRPSRRGDLHTAMLLQNVIHGGGSNVMMRRNVVSTVGFFDDTFPAIEDYDYWLRITRFFRVDYVEDPLIRYHDPRDARGRERPRKSLAVRDNVAGRAHFFDKHRAAMRRAGVAHRFLLESAKRHLAPACGDAWGARRLILRALLEAPTSRAVHAALYRSLIPAGLRAVLRRARRRARKVPVSNSEIS